MENKLLLQKTFRDLEDKLLKANHEINFNLRPVSEEMKETVKMFEGLCLGRSVSNNIITFFRLLEDLVDKGVIGASYEEKRIEIGNCKRKQ
jgi:hypothetical protein